MVKKKYIIIELIILFISLLLGVIPNTFTRSTMVNPEEYIFSLYSFAFSTSYLIGIIALVLLGLCLILIGISLIKEYTSLNYIVIVLSMLAAFCSGGVYILDCSFVAIESFIIYISSIVIFLFNCYLVIKNNKKYKVMPVLTHIFQTLIAIVAVVMLFVDLSIFFIIPQEVYISNNNICFNNCIENHSNYFNNTNLSIRCMSICVAILLILSLIGIVVEYFSKNKYLKKINLIIPNTALFINILMNKIVDYMYTGMNSTTISTLCIFIEVVGLLRFFTTMKDNNKDESNL